MDEKDFWTVGEVIEIYELEEEFLLDLEEEEILCPVCLKDSPAKLFSRKDMENLRVAKILFEEMGVNLPGIEVILHMRDSMYRMRRQFDDILEDLARRVMDRMRD
jgi:MerR family transcriptional regulator, heat shock protein HspR